MNWIKIDSDSYGTILGSWIVCAILIFLVAHFVHNLWISLPISLVLVVFMVFITWFFRVPNRTAPFTENDRLVTTVADGKVVIVEKVFEKEYLMRDCIQISVYMDFFDVHCNFWPMNGTVTYYKYHPGKFLVAFNPKSSSENEHNSIVIQDAKGREVLVRQIAGFVARRIVCDLEPGEPSVAGEEFGMIRFGSRVDVFLPLDAEVDVHIGQKVKAKATVLATLGS